MRVARLTTALRVAAAGVLVLSATAVTAAAQTRYTPASPHRGSWEIAGGLIWAGGFDLGAKPANETRNSTTDTSPVTLFSTNTRLGSANGGTARLGYYVTRDLSIGAAVVYSRPTVSTRITGDFEQADSLTATETLSHYVFDGSAVYHLSGIAFSGGRGVPFVGGGAGYLRDVHDGNGLIETGSLFHIGGGVDVWLTEAHRLGLRADFGVSNRKGGFDFEQGRRTVPTGGISLAFLF